MDTLGSDIRYALRKLARAPLFTAIAAATLALGIGANTAIFSVVYGVLMRPLPFDRPEELVRVYTVVHGDATWANSPTNYLELKQSAPSLGGLLLYDDFEATLTGRGEPAVMQAVQVSHDFFDVLGVHPVLGRSFEARENEVGANHVVVIGYGFWQDHFGGDPDALGGRLTLNGVEHEIVGVAPRGFRFPDGVRLWVPIAFTDVMRTAAFGNLSFNVIGRLAPGATVERARAEALAQAATVHERVPTMPNFAADVRPLLDAEIGSARTPLLVLLAAVGFVLLIACANIANLLLARSTAREAEFAVRRALGAGRRRVVQQLLVESLMLSLVGGLAGVFIALWATDALIAMSPDGLPRVDEIRVDATALLFALGIALATGFIFGLVPALHLARREPAATLKAGARTMTGGANRARGALLVAEVALAVVLLTGAGLLINSFARLLRVEPGFDVEGAVAARLWLPPADYPGWDEVRLFQDQVIAAIANLPDVQAVGTVQALPLAGIAMQLGMFDQRQPPATPDELRVAAVRAVSPGFFDAAGVRVQSGRGFDSSDRAGSAPVVLLSRAAARTLFGDRDPVGERVQLTMARDSAAVAGEVVGVVADTRVASLIEEPHPVVYLPAAQVPLRTIEIVVRSRVPEAALAQAIRTEVHRFGPNLAVNVRPLQHLVDGAVAQLRFYTLVLGAFAVTALLLAAVGIFGVFSFMVEQRRREIGIRIALGARRATVVRMVVERAGRLAAVGLAAGLAGAAVLTRSLSSLLYGVEARDPFTFIGVAIVLGCVALLASYLPARAAARLDPLMALRPE